MGGQVAVSQIALHCGMALLPPPRATGATALRRARGWVSLSWAARAGRACGALSRRTGLGSGGVIVGRVMLALAPEAPRILAQSRDVLAVSGTNGKTTTTAYLTAALATLGPVDTNDDGANTAAGITTSLAAGTAPRVVIETDERWLPWLIEATKPSIVTLLNLSRDQLHRHHEVAHLAHAWSDALCSVPHVVASASDPAVVMAALAARKQTWVAVGSRWTQDGHVCPRCGGECVHEGADWGCDVCGLCKPTPDWWLEGDELVSKQFRLPLRLALPGEVNRANAAMAVATAALAGVEPSQALAAVRDIAAVAGRYAIAEHQGRRARVVLAKNPAGWLESLAIVAGTTEPLILAFNSEGVDGRDPSWLYDVPFDHLAGRRVVVTGRRATDMLVRLEMAGLTDIASTTDVLTALEMLPEGDVTVIANYTAFQEARRVLAR
jgi:UDP-N-acetylmuramyl tripeptide synthase